MHVKLVYVSPTSGQPTCIWDSARMLVGFVDVWSFARKHSINYIKFCFSVRTHFHRHSGRGWPWKGSLEYVIGIWLCHAHESKWKSPPAGSELLWIAFVSGQTTMTRCLDDDHSVSRSSLRSSEPSGFNSAAKYLSCTLGVEVGWSVLFPPWLCVWVCVCVLGITEFLFLDFVFRSVGALFV